MLLDIASARTIRSFGTVGAIYIILRFSSSHPCFSLSTSLTDTGHPTERVHKLMADAIREQLLDASHATD